MGLTKYNAFYFKDYAFDESTGTLLLRYAYEDGPLFEEKYVFPMGTRVLSENDRRALDGAFRLIFLMAGVSYYKAYIPSNLRCLAFPLDAKMAAFVEKVYRNGLGEFAYRNKVEVKLSVFSEEVEAPSPVDLSLMHRCLVPVGGGKDSAVTIEILRCAKEPITLFATGSGTGLATPIQKTIDVSGLPSLAVKRSISPRLLELNRDGALNGHVPITAILSGVAVACAILHGIDTVVFSNENSSSAPNVVLDDLEINHQYSKSLAFETDFAEIVRASITPSLRYFSLLRPLTEAEIARRFAKLEKYHPVFRSCNTAFRQDEKLRGKTWCCDCPKCRFVFLALAPFIDKDKLIGIFGQNMLADLTQMEGFRELCGLAAHKPFECVGEVEESALLMRKLSLMPSWKDDGIVAQLSANLGLLGEDFDDKFKALFMNRSDHRLSEHDLGMLHACR